MARAAARSAVSEGAVVTKAALRAAGLLGVSNKVLGRIIGLSEASVSRMGSGAYTLTPGEKPFELAVLFVRFYRALDARRAWRRRGGARVGGEPQYGARRPTAHADPVGPRPGRCRRVPGRAPRSRLSAAAWPAVLAHGRSATPRIRP